MVIFHSFFYVYQRVSLTIKSSDVDKLGVDFTEYSASKVSHRNIHLWWVQTILWNHDQPVVVVSHYCCCVQLLLLCPIISPLTSLYHHCCVNCWSWISWQLCHNSFGAKRTYLFCYTQVGKLASLILWFAYINVAYIAYYVSYIYI